MSQSALRITLEGMYGTGEFKSLEELVEHINQKLSQDKWTSLRVEQLDAIEIPDWEDDHPLNTGQISNELFFRENGSRIQTASKGYRTGEKSAS